MATGAGDEYWKEQALPSVFKHTLLDKYMPQFAGMTGSAARGRRVVYLDGYAGRGRVPLFLFLDPCGLGVPYRELTGLLSAERSQT